MFNYYSYLILYLYTINELEMNKNDILKGNILNFHPRFNEEILSLGIEKFDDIYLESGEHILLEGDYCDFIFLQKVL